MGSTQRHYIAGGQEKRKDRKARKSKSEEKVVGFMLVSLFPTRKREEVTQGGFMEPGGDRSLTRRTQGAGIVKGWEDQRDSGHIPGLFT